MLLDCALEGGAGIVGASTLGAGGRFSELNSRAVCGAVELLGRLMVGCYNKVRMK